MYVPRKPSPIKIGFSTNPGKRLPSYRGHPYPVQLLGMWEGTRDDEQAIHRQFFKYRMKGEWFRPNPELRELIQRKIKEDEARAFERNFIEACAETFNDEQLEDDHAYIAAALQIHDPEDVRDLFPSLNYNPSRRQILKQRCRLERRLAQMEAQEPMATC